MALLWTGVGISVFALWAVWPEMESSELGVALPLALVMSGMLLWLGYGTGYSIEGDWLVIRCGPFRMRV